MSDKIIPVTAANFEAEVLKSPLPVLVDFWAEWCGPCRAMGKTLEIYAAENAGKVKIVKIDVDKSPDLAQQFGITSIPTVILMKDGKMAGKMVGNQPKKALSALVEGALQTPPKTNINSKNKPAPKGPGA